MLVYKTIRKLPWKKTYVLNAVTALAVFALVLTPWITHASLRLGKLTPVASTLSKVPANQSVAYWYEYTAFHTPGYEPGAEITLQKTLLIKFKNFFRFWRSGAMGVFVDKLIEMYPAAQYLILLYRIGFYVLLALTFGSLYYLMKNKAVLLLWLVISYFWAFHTVIHTSPRFTLPIIPLMLLLAYFSLFSFYDRYKQTRKITPSSIKNQY